MCCESYIVVYDAATAGYRDSWVVLMFFFGGLGLPLLDAAVRSAYRAQPGASVHQGRDVGLSNRGKILGSLLMSLVFAPLLWLGTYLPQRRLVSALTNRHYALISGPVVEYRRGDPGQLVVESSGRRVVFRYSEHEFSPGYRAASDTTGLLRPGAQVRIADVRGHIARLEVARTPAVEGPAP